MEGKRLTVVAIRTSKKNQRTAFDIQRIEMESDKFGIMYGENCEIRFHVMEVKQK